MSMRQRMTLGFFIVYFRNKDYICQPLCESYFLCRTHLRLWEISISLFLSVNTPLVNNSPNGFRTFVMEGCKFCVFIGCVWCRFSDSGFLSHFRCVSSTFSIWSIFNDLICYIATSVCYSLCLQNMEILIVYVQNFE